MGRYKSAFISYSTDAQTKANQITSYLKEIRVDTYNFSRDMGAGANVPKNVKDAIKARDAVVLVLSAQSRASTWVAAELGYAAGRDKPILVYRTPHNLKVPDYLDVYENLNKLEDLDDYFVQPES